MKKIFLTISLLALPSILLAGSYERSRKPVFLPPLTLKHLNNPEGNGTLYGRPRPPARQATDDSSARRSTRYHLGTGRGSTMRPQAPTGKVRPRPSAIAPSPILLAPLKDPRAQSRSRLGMGSTLASIVGIQKTERDTFIGS
jgi:hypothetical protein